MRGCAKEHNHSLKIKGRVRARGARGQHWYNDRRTELARKTSRTQALWYLHLAGDWSEAFETEAHLLHFAQNSTAKRFYSDSELYIAAARELKWRCDGPKPHDPQSNGLIEVHVGIVKDGVRALLFQAGMPAICWPWAVK